jgi:1,3-beta-glucan synthase
VVFLGTLNHELNICRFNEQGQFIANQGGCYQLAPVFGWIKRRICLILLVLMIAFLPLLLQGQCYSLSVFYSWMC